MSDEIPDLDMDATAEDADWLKTGWPWRSDFTSVEDLRTFLTEELGFDVDEFKTWPRYKWNKDKVPFLNEL